MPEHAATPPAAERAALAPQARRPLGRFPVPPGVPARRAAAAALVAVAALAAPGAWAAVSMIVIASNPGPDMTYTPVGTADVVQVDVTFQEVVAVSGQPVFQLVVGSTRRAMAYDTGSGTNTLRFVYTVRTGDLDEDGVSYPANALEGGTITDSGNGVAIDRTFPALAREEGHKVDGVAPRLTATQIVSNPAAAGTYAIGETITVDVLFDEDVDATASATALDLDFDGSAFTAARSRANGGTLTYAYTVAAGNADRDGLVVPVNALLVQDQFGNVATRNTVALRTEQKVDGVAPTARRTAIVSNAGPDRTYREGDAIDIQVVFSEAMRVPASSTLTLQLGVASMRSASYLSGDGTDRASFRYEVVAGDMDADGISFAADALAGSAITDGVGNAFEGGIAAVSAQRDHRVDGGVDTDPPRVTDVAVTSTPTRTATYSAGQRIEVSIRFNEPVAVVDPNELKLGVQLGNASVSADFASLADDVLRFGYTVAAGDLDVDGIAVGPIAESLVGGTIQDLSENVAVRAFPALPAQSRHKVDGVAPAATDVEITSVPSADETYGVGEDIYVTVRFSETVVAAHDPDLRLGIVIGESVREANLASGEGTTALVFRYRVQEDDYDADGVSIEPGAFAGGTVQDRPGNDAAEPQPRLELPNQAGHRVDARASEAATVTFVSDPGDDDTYADGDTIILDVRFPEEVTVSGTPELLLSVGEHERRATLVRQRASLLTFRYIVRRGDLDEDGVSVGARALVGVTVVDTLGNPAGRLTPLPDQAGHRVDGIVPIATGVAITSNAGADNTYGPGETIRLTVSFSELVHANESLTLPVQIGGRTRNAAFLDGSGTPTLRFGYLVAPDDRDADGISVGADPLSCGGDDALSCITDGAGNPAVEAIAGLPAQPRHRVDGRRDAARLYIASSPESGSAYRAGERIELHLEYPAAVSVRRNPDLTPEFPELVVSVGAAQRVAVFADGSGTPTLRFTYTVQPDDADDDGISVAGGPRSLRGGIIEDEDGNAASRNFDALPDDDAHRIDGVVPVALGNPTIVSRPASGDAYGRDEVIEVAVTFSETVHVKTRPVLQPELHLILEIGGRSRQAEFRDGSGTDTLLFAYEVVEGDYDADGISIGPNALQGDGSGGEIVDAAGNPAVRDTTALPAQPDHKVNPDRDLVSPAVAQVEIVSTPATDSYQAEETIEVGVAFTEPVHVTGEPTLEISIGMATRRADLAAGSGTETLVFHYVVVDGDLDTDGVSIGPGPASLAGGTITDAAANSAERAFPGLPADRAHTVNVGREPATVASVRFVSAPRSYNAGDVIEVQAEFTKVVDVTGAPAILVSVGDAERRAVYSVGTGTDTLLFRYVVQPGEVDEDGVSIPADSLLEGQIEDAAGSPVVRSFAAVPEDIRHVVDAQPPTVLSVAPVSDAGSESGYTAGDRIDIAVVFDDEVHVGGQPALTLSVGRYDRNAYYATGSGTRRFLFSYVVQNDDRDDDGISISADALRGGTIEDSAGNAADRSFNARGPFPAHTVAARDDAPTVASVEIIAPANGTTFLLGEDIEIRLVFTEEVHVAGQPVVELTVGGAMRAAAFAAGSGTETLAFRYTVQAGDLDEDGVSIGAGALVGGTIADAAGNPATRVLEAVPARDDRRVDAVVPTVMSVRIVSELAQDETYGPGEAIEVEVAFGEEVHVTGAPYLTVSVGANSRSAAFATGSGTERLRFRYEVQDDDYDEDGISIAADALEGGSIEDASGNPVDRSFTALAADPAHMVDGDVVAPVVVELTIGPPKDGGTFLLGEDIEIRLVFTEEVHVAGQPAVELTVGGTTRAAAFAAGNGTDTLAFRYTVQAGDLDEDGVSIGAGALVGGTIADAAGNPATRVLEAVPARDDRRVDAVVPTVMSVRIVSELAQDETYGPGEAIEVEVAFGEEVHVTGAPYLTVSVGANSRSAAFATGSGTERLRFRYEVQDDDYDEDGISIAADALEGGSIEDASGNPVDRSFTALAADPAHMVGGDVIAPVVVELAIGPPKDGGTFLLGEDIEIRLVFSEEVHVAGQPAVELTVGGATRAAAFAAGNGTETLAFRYTVQAGDLDEDGVSIGAGALVGGTIADAAGNPATRVLEAVPARDDRRVDAVVPTVSSVRIVSEPAKGETYGPGEAIEVEVAFGENVHVTGEPYLTVSVGANSRSAAFATGNGTQGLLFRYVVQDDDYDEDGISIAADALAGGVVEDESGNPAERFFEALAAAPLHRVDAVPARVASGGVSITSVPGSDGVYVRRETIDIAVTFDEEVLVSGRPSVALSVGAETRAASFAEGSGTATLLFRYEVRAGDLDMDGVSVLADSLTGGEVTDRAGNRAVLDFDGFRDEGHKVDAVAPAVLSVKIASEPGEDGTYVPGDAIEIEVEFGDAVHVTGDAVLTISVGANSRPAAFASGSGTESLLFRYVVQDDDFDDDGISIAANALAGGAVEDESGNPAERFFEALAANPLHRVGAAVTLLLEPLRIEVGASETLNLAALLATAGFPYDGDFDAESDVSDIVYAETVGARLTVRGVGEGVATVAVAARRAHIALLLPITVEASAAEREVLHHTLGAVARGLLSSAADTIGARLRAGANRSAPWMPLSPQPGSPYEPATAGVPRHRVAAGHPGFGAAHAPADRSGFVGPQSLSFAMPLSGLGNRAASWGVWGSADVQAFAGEPEQGNYDGRLNTVQIGADARGDRWMAGASVSRSRADADYQFQSEAEGGAEGAGTLETEITAVYPYVGWTLDDRAEFWTILGFGTGDATSLREGQPATDDGTGLSMRLGLAGTRIALGRSQGFALAVRGDAGFVQLVTDDGLRAVEGLEVNAQRVRAGVEASWPTPVGVGVFVPFIDLGGRWDGGDGATGGGLEVAGGFRYRTPTVGVEVKARTLALHGADGYRENGLAATAFLEPGGSGRGLRLSLTPRWGSPDWTGRLWRPDAAGPAAPRGDEPAWMLDGRAGYGLGLRGGPGSATPFAEMGLTPDGRDRARVGVAYELGAAKDLPTSRFEMSVERAEHARGIMHTRLLVVVEGRFR